MAAAVDAMDPQPETVADAGSSPGGCWGWRRRVCWRRGARLGRWRRCSRRRAGVDGGVSVVAVGLAMAVAIVVDRGGCGRTGEEQAHEGLQAQGAEQNPHSSPGDAGDDVGTTVAVDILAAVVPGGADHEVIAAVAKEVAAVDHEGLDDLSIVGGTREQHIVG